MSDDNFAYWNFNEGSGEHLCLGMYKDLTATELSNVNAALATFDIATSATDSTAMQIDYNLADGAMMNLGASVVDAVFGNGSYCEGNMGADKESISYRIVGGASYSNINNSKWSMSPSFAWSEDISGYGPSSLGGFTEGRQSLSLGLGFVSGNTSVNLSYVDQLGDDQANTRNDMDSLSASVSHSF